MGVLGPPPEFLKRRNLSNFGLALFTFFLINVTWVFFRAPDFHSAWGMLSAMFGGVAHADPMLTTLAMIKIAIIIVAVVICHWLMRNTRY